MDTIKAKDFIVAKNDLHQCQWINRTDPETLQPNQVLLRIDRFALTSNNISYAVQGDRMQYWDLFPTQPGFGIIPTWGFAEVVSSNHPGIKVGDRYYGFLPMGTHLPVQPTKVSNTGFLDATRCRRSLSPVYNLYTSTKNDTQYALEKESLISIFRPLFNTSFLIDDFLGDQNFFRASRVLITGASSKTAQALVYLLSKRRQAQTLGVSLIGLTSSRNKAFVQTLGWYDEVMEYADLESMEPNASSVVVDFSGSNLLQRRLQMLLNDRLVYNCLVGFVDWQNLLGENGESNSGEFFFAPTHGQKRMADWGAAGFQQRVTYAWTAFTNMMESVIKIHKVQAIQLEATYLKTLKGQIDPGQGNIVVL